jgi:hypothetical protein
LQVAALEFEGVKPHLLLNTGLLTATLLRGEEEVVQVRRSAPPMGSTAGAQGYSRVLKGTPGYSSTQG